MERIEGFLKYLNKFKPNSAEHYESGLRATSKDMISEGVINKPLEEMTVSEFEIAIILILNNDFFIAKNNKGKRMYSNSIKLYQSYLRENISANDYAEIERKILEDPTLKKTEQEELIMSRIGQGKFRKGLIEKYKECIVSGIKDTRLLIASHIKPWSVSSNEERLDVENGLLLNALYDKMFDLGIISFNNNGQILVSNSIKSDDLDKLKIDTETRYNLILTKKLRYNLEYHRDAVFIT